MLDPRFSIGASAYLDAFKNTGIDHVVTVPDWVQWAVHRRLDDGIPGIKVITTSNEDQAMVCAAGLTISGKRPIVLVQNQGLYACVNTIRAIALDARIPTVLMVGQFGRELANIGKDPAQSTRNVVRLVEPVLDALGVDHLRVDCEVDLASLERAYGIAQEKRSAVVCIVGAPIAWH
ncbi:thiamine pyrophosphate-binding protein [Paraburkholderia sp. ZP32-5]|uniref:thiamine pyrophosphate-binding protein n=1 Tax=Paraburkholderia sp. ZP32-5 TaxID=2883245 RepID=UPI001F3C6E31|nr:thiamine pyrophosphate-binding protein [Paraburkholderia sp. ZP32-5]